MSVETARKLPASETVERELVSAFLYGHKDSHFIFDALLEDFFMDRTYRRLYTVGKKLYLGGKPFDVVSVSDAMDAAELESIGGLQGLAELPVGMFATYNVENACRIVTKKAQQRALIYALDRIQEEAWDLDGDMDSFIDRALLEITEVSKRAASTTDDPTDLDAGMEMLARLDDADEIRIVSGIKALDAITGGFRAGELVVMTAETGTGKTLFASQIKRVCCARGWHCLFANGEMLAHHLRAREAAVEAHVRYDKFRNPERMSEAERQAVTRVVAGSCTKCRIMDGELTIGRIRSRTRKYSSKGDISYLIVDYDELVEAPGKDEFAEQKQVVRGLKSLALELRMPAILISQLRKPLQNEDRAKPTISRLYGSGSKVKTASIILYVDRPFVRELEGDEAEARIVVVKNRDGRVGAIPCRFNVTSLTFEDEPGS
jgi:replicative DNA helicase